MRNDEYITIQGDTWDMISFKVYGEERHMHRLIQSNLQYKDIVVFPANIKIVIPQVSIRVPSMLPPWKRERSL